MATVLETAAHSVEHMFSLYFDYLYFLLFEGWIWVLIVSIPDLCKLFTFISLFHTLRM